MKDGRKRKKKEARTKSNSLKRKFIRLIDEGC